MSYIPFKLFPAGKDYLWGGNRLKTDFHKSSPLTPLAETWECSTHKDGESRAEAGEFSGRTLTEILTEHEDMLGSGPLSNPHRKKGELPVLVKLIDAEKDLSVQVHPDDEYANRYENGQAGKTEFWYVLDAKQNASLVYGFSREVTRKELSDSLNGVFDESLLKKVPVKKGDGFLIEAGTVHAIGAGILLAEIQENSNLTYRLYDYNRMGADGKKRELHIEKSLAVANLTTAVRTKEKEKNSESDILCECSYFTVRKKELKTEEDIETFSSMDTSFQVLLCCDGEGDITLESGETKRVQKGDCYFVPAHSEAFCVKGRMLLLTVTC